MSYKTHVIISVENKQRANRSKGETDFVYQLTQPIKFQNKNYQKQYFVRCENIRIPISFYNINQYNNTFIITDNSVQYTIIITEGNYTIDELTAELQTQLNATTPPTFTITYDDITQKVNIARNTSTGSSVIDNGTLNDIIGFSQGQTIANGGNTDGNNVAYTNTMRHVKLQISNLVSNNLYSNDSDLITQVQPISTIIPITEIRNEFQFVNNHMGPMIKLGNINTISDISVKLLDPNNNLVNMNGVPFGFEIVIYEYNK